MRPDEMSPRPERFARDVAPRLRARFGGPARPVVDEAGQARNLPGAKFTGQSLAM
jgi:hypothetical protein